MFGDWENYHDEEETLDVLKRYQEMLIHRRRSFFDLNEYECLIDYFIEQFNFRDAISAVNLAIKQYPYASSMKLKYVRLLIETGKPAKALSIIKGMGNSESSNYELFLAKGIALNLTGKYREAFSVFEKAIALCDESGDEVAYSIALSYIQIGMHSQALKYLLDAYRLNTDNILVLYDLALTYEKLDCPEKSIFYYNKYLDLDPFAEHIWNNLGLVYTSLNDVEKATEAFDMAIAINPGYFPAYYNKADMLLMMNDLNGAIRVYAELLTEDNDNIKALCDSGHCYEEAGDIQEAFRLFRKALTIDKDCSDAWYGLGLIYFKQRKFRFSMSVLKKAIDIQPDNSDYWFMLGETFAGMRRYNMAIQAYTKAYELNPLDFEAWMASAQVLFRRKRIEEAIHTLKQIYQYNHDNSTVNYRLAAYYIYHQNPDTALFYFEKGLKLNFGEHKEIFRYFPKTKICHDFQRLVKCHACAD